MPRVTLTGWPLSKGKCKLGLVGHPIGIPKPGYLQVKLGKNNKPKNKWNPKRNCSLFCDINFEPLDRRWFKMTVKFATVFLHTFVLDTSSVSIMFGHLSRAGENLSWVWLRGMVSSGTGDRQTDRQTDKREIERERERARADEGGMDGWMDRSIDRSINRSAEIKEKEKQIDRQTQRERERQREREERERERDMERERWKEGGKEREKERERERDRQTDRQTERKKERRKKEYRFKTERIRREREREKERKGDPESQPLFGPSVGSLCHPRIKSAHFSYSFPIFETSATVLRGTTWHPW